LQNAYPGGPSSPCPKNLLFVDVRTFNFFSLKFAPSDKFGRWPFYWRSAHPFSSVWNPHFRFSPAVGIRLYFPQFLLLSSPQGLFCSYSHAHQALFAGFFPLAIFQMSPIFSPLFLKVTSYLLLCILTWPLMQGPCSITVHSLPLLFTLLLTKLGPRLTLAAYIFFFEVAPPASPGFFVCAWGDSFL